MDKDRVLLIDDEQEFVEALGERLRTRGIFVDIATSGDEGIEKAKKMNFHAVILDLAMPGMDGIETLKALREQRPDIQVMLLSGQTTIKAAVEATRLGAVDILEKPTDIDTLLEKIREARANHIAIKEQQSKEQVEEVMRKYGW